MGILDGLRTELGCPPRPCGGIARDGQRSTTNAAPAGHVPRQADPKPRSAKARKLERSYDVDSLREAARQHEWLIFVDQSDSSLTAASL